MLKRKLFWLTLILVSIVALPGWSLPNSLMMQMEISSKQGGRPMKGDVNLWYANKKFRMEVTSNVNMSQTNTPVKIANKATFIMDVNSKIGFMLDDTSKTAIKIDQNQVGQMTGAPAQGGIQTFSDPASLTDPAKLKAEIQKAGGKQVGSATLLGHKCSIWQMSNNVQVPVGQGKMEQQNVTSKIWLADALGMPLKVEVKSDKMGTIVDMRAKKIQVNIPINASMFGVPAGYNVRDLMDMYKSK